MAYDGKMTLRGPYESSIPPRDPVTLGERLRWLRKQRGLTQVEMAELLGCEQTVISVWETDRTRPAAVAMKALARFHQLPVGVLDTGEGFLELATGALEAMRESVNRDPSSMATPTLEPVPGGKVAVVDLLAHQTEAAEHTEAISHLLRALKKGREVWIVLR